MNATEVLSKLGLSGDLIAQILGQNAVVPIQRRYREKAALGKKRANEVGRYYKKIFAFEDFKLCLYVWCGHRWCAQILDRDDREVRKETIYDNFTIYGDVVDVGPCLEIGWETSYNGEQWPAIRTRNEAMEAVCNFLYASNVACYGTVYN